MKNITPKWFWKDATGLKSDIERHRVNEQEMIQKIEELESSDLPDKEIFIRAYRGLLCSLQQSKAEVVSKIGMKRGEQLNIIAAGSGKSIFRKK